jgi:hypothetical protein
LTTTMTPAGTITYIHDDGLSGASFVFVILGVKILLAWPGIENNRLYFSAYSHSQHLFILEDEIERLSGMKVTILRAGDGVVMDYNVGDFKMGVS